MTKRTASMLIIIPFDLPWEHTADYAHQTAYELSKNHIVVCYMQKEAVSIREYLFGMGKFLFWKSYSPNMYLYYPLFIVPFRRFEMIERFNTVINTIWLKIFLSLRFFKVELSRKLLWMFYPDYEYIVPFFGKDFDCVYDCVDFHAERSKKEEESLILRCRYFFVNSFTLLTYHQKKRPDVTLVPQGFRWDAFRKPVSKAPIIFLPQPIIGYIGGINARLDIPLLFQLAQNMPRCLFLFVGPKQNLLKANLFDALRTLPNVRWLDDQRKEYMPSIISTFDIAMIPYDVKAIYNKNCYPMKLFEYFYMGKPVVATPVEELKRFGKFVKIGQNAQEWESHIERLLSRPWHLSNKREQRQLAQDNSWERKIQKILYVIELDQREKKNTQQRAPAPDS